MQEIDQVNYYCFNKECKISIFNSDDCVITTKPLSEALLHIVYCTACLEELVSKPILRMNRQLKEIMLSKKNYRTIVIDNGFDLRTDLNDVFQIANNFNEILYLANTEDAINYLSSKKAERSLIPDFIFLDIDLPEADCWIFLDQLAAITNDFFKKIDVYIITPHVTQLYDDRAKAYPEIKGILQKKSNSVI